MWLQKNTFVGFLPWLMSMSCLHTYPIFQDLWDGSLCTFWLKKRCHRLIWTKIIYSTSFLASWKYLCMCVPTAGCTLAPWECYCPWVFTHLLTLISCRWTSVWLQVPPRNTQQAPGSCPQPLGACQAPFSGFYSPECVWVMVRWFCLPPLHIRSKMSLPHSCLCWWLCYQSGKSSRDLSLVPAASLLCCWAHTSCCLQTPGLQLHWKLWIQTSLKRLFFSSIK